MLVSRNATIEHLVSRYGMDRVDASIATDYASAEGSHAITGEATLYYMSGKGWYVSQPRQ